MGKQFTGIAQRKKVITSAKEINELFKIIKKYGLTAVKIGVGQQYKSREAYMAANNLNWLPLAQYIIIDQKETKLEITTRYYEYSVPCTYIFDLNNQPIAKSSGLDTFREFNKYYKIPKASDYQYNQLDKWLSDETGKYHCSAKPIIGYNEKYEKQIHFDCYEYDLNSAYSNTVLEKIPDLSAPIKADYPNLIKVNKDEVGFLIDDNLTLVKPGYMADIKFKLIDTPTELKNWLINLYIKKSNAKGLEKAQAKAILNYPYGYCQRYNPFLRSYVIHNCNEKIRRLIDHETLFWNTDAIFTLNKRTDLDIGNNIGQFKEIKCNKLVYIGNTYQIDDEYPTYRGISKTWFKAFELKHGRKYDLLTDYNETVDRINYYTLNWDELKLEVNKIWAEN